uniref:C2H2-type domain-containing protein n=1 Tax=Oryza brachyantha TaxID=4533 RepID=J3LFH9_ORYBR
MPKNACKLCCRRFASPRALAGHMRSHSVATANAAAAAAVAPATKLQISSASSASTSFPAADEEEEEDVGFKKPLSIYTLRENPKRSLRVSEYAFSDRESEAESTPTPAAKSARTGDGEPMSSLSYVGTPEEEPPLPEHEADEEDMDGKAVPHECPYCYRVFSSGQALGGHKRSHLCSAAAAAAHAQTAGASPPSQAKILGMIDLNIAPPVDEVELSAVSDPHFPNNPCL